MLTLAEIKRKLADYCVYQDRSHWEVEQKLAGFYFLNEEEKGEIIVHLIQNNFLNEERFAKSYARGKFYQKYWGRNKITMRLKQKQVPNKLIEEGLKEIDEEEYRAKLKELAQEKWEIIKAPHVFSRKQKLVSYLLQKGYESSLIYDLLDDFS